MNFSLIVPVYNRPDEVNELLQSLVKSTYKRPFEIVLIEDGSSIPCWDVVSQYTDSLSISYYDKPNSGPGDSRNYGMRLAKGDYFLIFDSDCVIPPQYLDEVAAELQSNYTDCFGGPDAAMSSFSNLQKAINFAMTSVLTTGGIRGGSEKIEKFQPRSFNMGISKTAFDTSGGFGNIHPGEDPDLSIRLWKLGFTTRLFPKAFVYHKRRISWEKFHLQVNKFGKTRPILNHWHPEYARVTYILPSVFIIGFAFALLLSFVGFGFFLKLYAIYFCAIFLVSTIGNRSLKVGIMSVVAVAIQMYGYGTGFLQSYIRVTILKQHPQSVFPELFFSK